MESWDPQLLLLVVVWVPMLVSLARVDILSNQLASATIRTSSLCIAIHSRPPHFCFKPLLCLLHATNWPFSILRRAWGRLQFSFLIKVNLLRAKNACLLAALKIRFINSVTVLCTETSCGIHMTNNVLFCQTMKSTTIFVLATETSDWNRPLTSSSRPPISEQLFLPGRNSILSPWCLSSCTVCTLITLQGEPESINNTSLLTSPMLTEITGSAEVDKAYVCSPIVRANVSSSPDCLNGPSTKLACLPLQQLTYVWCVPIKTQFSTEERLGPKRQL